MPPPFDFIPTAGHALAAEFRRTLNAWLYVRGRHSVMGSKIHRFKTYAEDYGAMDAAQRLALITADAYHLDRGFLEGRLILFLGDIRITGSHEAVIRRQLAAHDLALDCVFVYFAALDNPAVAPDYENRLNFAGLDSLDDLIEIITAEDFEVNTRVVKYLLRLARAPFESVILRTDAGLLRSIVDHAIGNNYHRMREYQHNLTSLTDYLQHGHQSSERTAPNPQRA